MKIEHLNLNNLIQFQTSKIVNFDMQITEPIQIIIGTNGSGKSSLLRELFPNPPTKPLFSSDGFKSLIVSHECKTYELIFSYELGHSFIVDGIDLNKNNTFNLQKELIEKHLGLSQSRQNILNCDYKLSTLTPSNRKNLLLELNPIDISLFIEKLKSVHKQTIRHSANLSMLLDRQKELLEKRLPEEEYRKLIATKEKLENQEKLLLIWITKTRGTLDSVIIKDVVNNRIDLYKVKSDFFNVVSDIKKSISSESHESDSAIMRTEMNLSNNKITMKSLHDETRSLIDEIEDLERKRASVIEVDEDLSSKIDSLQNKLNTYDFPDEFVPIEENRIRYFADSVLTRLNDIVNNISHSSSKIIILKVIESKKEELSKLSMKLNSMKNELDSLQEQQSQLNKLVKDYSTPDNCQKNVCQLFNKYNTHQTKMLFQLAELEKAKREISDKIPDIEYRIKDLQSTLTTQKSLWILLREIQLLIENNNELLRIVKSDELISILNSSPYALINQASSYVNDSLEWHSCISIQRELSELIKRRDLMKDRSTISVDLLDKEINKKREELSIKLIKYNQLDNLSKELKRQLDSLNLFVSKMKDLKRLNNVVNEAEIASSNRANHEYLHKLMNIMNRMLNDIRAELMTIAKITKDQESIITRLDNEINIQIEKTRKKYEASKKIEETLFQLQVEYTRSFVNNVIESMNYFISLVFAYPMEIHKFDDDKDIDFQFSISVKDWVKIKDISTCSSGQKCVIDLAFNLALILELKLHDYALYVDELDSALDSVHKQRLLELFKALLDKKIVNQLFVVNHNTDSYEGFLGEYVVIDSTNIVVPAVFNNHVKIKYSE